MTPLELPEVAVDQRPPWSGHHDGTDDRELTRPAPPPRLVLKQQLSVLRQRPEVVGDDRLELVDDVAQGGLRWDDGRGEHAGFVMDRSGFVRVVLRIAQPVD